MSGEINDVEKLPQATDSLTSGEIADIKWWHTKNRAGNCHMERFPWPCDALRAALEVERSREQLAAAEARAALWKRAAKKARSDWHDAMRYWHASAEAYGREKATGARQAEQLAALTKIGNEAAQLHEMTAQYIAVLEPTWLPEDHESRGWVRAQVVGHRSRVEQIQAVLAAAEQPAAPSGEGGS